jgi:hypothetical protein
MPTSPFDFTSGSVITAAELNAIGDFDTWTPSWTNITPNSATVEAYYARVNELVFWQLEFIGAADTVYGTSTPFQFSLPSDAPAVTNNAYAPICKPYVCSECWNKKHNTGYMANYRYICRYSSFRVV